MKSILLLLFIAPFSLLASTITPPDSTTAIVDKAKAIFYLDKGKTFYSQGQVRKAYKEFKDAHLIDPNNSSVLYYKALCLYDLGNYGNALKDAMSAYQMDSAKIENEVYFLIGESFHRLSNYDSAVYFLKLAKQKINKNHAKDLMIDMKIAQVEFSKEEANKGHVSKLKKVEGFNLNTGYQDYNPILNQTGDTMYFTSKRPDTKGGGMNPDDLEYFEDIYMVVNYGGKWDSVTNDLGRLNTEGFDAFTYLSEDGKYGLMTINTEAMESPNPKTKGSDLFEIKMSNKGKWSTPRKISNKTINTSYFEGSATITADGNTMYFVSDRKGDESSTDIYVVSKNGKVWGEAKPLPKTINTIGRETTPFISPDGRWLFFSSDGLLGMGGYDIFVVENLGDAWGEPVNLGATINTVNNDTHFRYYEQLKKAFMTNVQISGNVSSADIFEVDMEGFQYPTKK